MYMAFPFFLRGASSIKFVEYLNKNIFPVFDQLLEEQKLCLLQSVAYISPYTSWELQEMILSSIVLLLEKCMALRKVDGEQMDFAYVECLLYACHHIPAFIGYKSVNLSWKEDSTIAAIGVKRHALASSDKEGKKGFRTEQ
ncbi:hypothetical protein Q3G72_007625 [Acer saccharum]|nr:hypothetical protein Q3G72_007625 [Acer saccharum]